MVFILVFAWKLALLLFTAQPVPSNDAFFYDGPVVNLLLHGKYCNPSLIHALPISGGEVFCAYPPLHQAVLLGWMSVFGASALSAMWLHVALLGLYFLIVFAILRRLPASPRVTNLAGLFLFGITFHDRPDTIAHVLGALALFGLMRGGAGVWVAAGSLALAFTASLQIGGVYLLYCGLLVLVTVLTQKSSFPWAATLATGAALAGLVALVKFGYPHLWAGFQEHVRITPSVVGWHPPNLMDSLKAVRMAPAIFAVGAGILWALLRRSVAVATFNDSPAGGLAICGTLAGLAIIGASLVKLSPNTIHIANYLQPLVVGAFLSSGMFFPRTAKPSRIVLSLFLALSLVTGLRAIGMTTWGVCCARDVSYAKAVERIRAEVDPLPAGSVVVASSAYLYDLARRTNITWIHNDWPAAPGGHLWENQAYAKLRPVRIIITQFDFYRRFRGIFERLEAHPDLVSLHVTNTASVRSPDSFPKMQRLVQHVAWAPVIVELTWR